MKINREDGVRTGGLRRTARYVVGLIVIVVLAAIAGVLCGQATAEPSSQAAKTTDSVQTPVMVTPAAMRQFERTLVVQGNVQTKEFAMVSPRIGGTLEAIYVDEGDAVVAGRTKLFQTDAVSLERNLQVKEQATIVAQCASREAAASLDKVTVDLRKAELDYNRFKRLYDQNAVTADAFEQQQSRYQQLQAARKLAEAQVELNVAKQTQSKAELEIARKELDDATIYAPIGGKISQRLREPGEMGSPGQPVLRIDDTSVLEVAASLPAQNYGEVTPGQTPMRVQVSGIDLGSQVITYKSPTIHPKLRTFEVKCLLKNPPAGVAPGAMAQIAVVLETRQGLGVPSSSIQNRSSGTVVFVVRDGAARQETVATGIEAAGWTEVRQGQVKADEQVVTLGQNMLNDGAAVQIQKEQK
jgi:RND family efflux transporter MFP subunit